jgi:hypothetical protein
MSTGSNAQRLTVVPDAEESNTSQPRVSTTAKPVVCSFCFDTGMEVVPGKGARRCRCRAEDAQKKLFEAAHIPRRYEECSLTNYQPAHNNGSQLRAFNYAYRLVRDTHQLTAAFFSRVHAASARRICLSPSYVS